MPQHRYCGDGTPHFVEVRRVPRRYYYTLPLDVMRQCQCVVLGSASGTLTIAITTFIHPHLLPMLSLYTKRTIFPVLVDSKRMQLLLRRLMDAHRRRSECQKYTSIIYLLDKI